jgi:hypothetical protein
LHCCADVFIADQAHLTKHLASVEAANWDAGIVEDVNLPADDYIKISARIAFAQNDFAFGAITKFKIFDHIAEIGLIDVAKKGKIAQEVDNAPYLITQRFGLVLDLHRSEVLKTDGTRAAGTGNHAVGDLIGPFVFDNDFGEIAVENFAGATGGGRVYHRGIDKGGLAFAFHADGNTGDLKDIAIAEQWAMSGFTDAKIDFRKPHGTLLAQKAKPAGAKRHRMLSCWYYA